LKHKGVSNVKEKRIDIGVRKTKMFQMKDDAFIDEMYKNKIKSHYRYQ